MARGTRPPRGSADHLVQPRCTAPGVGARVAAGGDAAIVDGGAFVLVRGAVRETVAPVSALPSRSAEPRATTSRMRWPRSQPPAPWRVPVEAIARGLAGFAGSAATTPAGPICSI